MSTETDQVDWPGFASRGEWQTFASAAVSKPHRTEDRPVRLRRVVLQFAAIAIAVLCVVALAGAIVSKRTAESQSVHEAAALTDVIASSLIQPVLSDAMADDPAAARS